jgi:ABC-type sugar transport system substrate-binding protein
MSGFDERASGGLSRRLFLGRAGSTALGLTAGGVLLSACGDDDESGGGVDRGNGKAQIAFSNPFSDVPVVATVRRLAGDYAPKVGYELLLDNTRAGELQPQLNAVESWVTQGVPAICVTPVEESALRPVAQRAKEAGLIWSTYGVESPESYGGVLFPAEISGEQVAKAAVEWINANAPDAEVFVHTVTTVPTLKPRYSIPIQLIKEQTSATIVGEQDAADQATGQRVTENILRAHPNLSVVIGVNDDGALGAVQAFSNANKDPEQCYISGNDGSPDALEALKQGGFFKATAALRIADVAKAIVDLNKDLIENGPPESGKRNKNMASVLVTQEDEAEVDKLLTAFREGG